MSIPTKKIITYTPGKIMLMGEWSILEVGNPCIALPVLQGVTVAISSRSSFGLFIKSFSKDVISFDFIKQKIIFNKNFTSQEEDFLCFVKSALETAFSYLECLDREITPCFIEIDSDISSLGNGKPGLGSSAAVVVAIIKGVLRFYNFEFQDIQAKNLLFKLSSIAHYGTQGSVGSCFDIAVSTYEEPIYYKRFDSTWLEERLSKNNDIHSIVNRPWPCLYVKKILFPKGMRILVGFVGYSSKTKNVIKKVDKFYKENRDAVSSIYSSITHLIDRFIRQDCSRKESLLLIHKNRQLLCNLAELAKIDLETKELKVLCDSAEQHGGSGKLSGAGGGDCGVAVCFDKKTEKAIAQDWQKFNIKLIDVIRF